MGFVIAVANLKGGVAKTTTAVSLGGALSEKGYAVLLVDLDVQGNLTQAVGFDPGNMQRSVSDVFFHWTPLRSASYKTRVAGLDVVPSNPGMELAERFLPIRKDFETILQKNLRQPPEHQFVIFDCPPSTGAVTINALNSADLVIIPLVPEVFSLKTLQKMLTILNKVKSGANPGLIIKILITMLDVRLKVHRDFREQLLQKDGLQFFTSFIQVDTKIRESSIAGLPVIQHAPESRSAQQYRALAEEILIYASSARK